MSISSYEGNTFVAFLDISGFKQMMNSKEKVHDVLNKFYSSLFYSVGDLNSVKDDIKLNIIAVSDCAVIFLSKGVHDNVDENQGLTKLLEFIRKVNGEFVEPHNNYPFLTTCSIAYGDFE